ncbi:methyltransferase [Salinarchaeum sp. Harcht-Bsk1]|uniref:hypothetical protein n=1 Tax=Salinarchaeum sp. Harcht-Bsk1 TaxID=1333523 RepID=UPI000342476E|nr:hypothetical protein [Salinarchaeum sp. Harcht-Bsk1]AGN01187.1 methyltransferase [Salinarchaeum sp. Harcht-Bsk1]
MGDDDPWDELLVERGFHDVETATFDVERDWATDQIVDYVFSLSFASPEQFGADAEAFECDLRDRLDEGCDGGGSFEQSATITVHSGRA